MYKKLKFLNIQNNTVSIQVFEQSSPFCIKTESQIRTVSYKLKEYFKQILAWNVLGKEKAIIKGQIKKN